jgi:hypothetical protein
MIESSLEPDPRWALITGGLDAQGKLLPMSTRVLASLAGEWPTSPVTPRGVTSLLVTTRTTFTLAWFHYELLVVSVLWSLFAVEAAIRDLLGAGEKPNYASLRERAKKEGLITEDEFHIMDAGRSLRNKLGHAREQGAWTLGMAVPVIKKNHHLISQLYQDRHESADRN